LEATVLEARGSGALVYTTRNKMGGMLFDVFNVMAISYFTHVDDLFDDIRKSPGATGIRVQNLDVYYNFIYYYDIRFATKADNFVWK
jgi:hypothetical protein